jgi:hypothetical protein
MRIKILAIAVVLAFVLLRTAFAWNKAGHMAIGAIAYEQLKQTNPKALDCVIELLKQHPQYQSRWAHLLDQRPAEEEKRLYLCMLAARWPDDIRDDPAYNHEAWHFIDVPFKPTGQPATVQTERAREPNVVTALEANLAVLRKADAKDADKAIALCWLFHLVGDIHQPLHTTTLFTTDFPQGDRGGTHFYIHASPTARTSISLHKFWDDLILGSDRFQGVRNRETLIRQQHPAADFKEQLAEPTSNFEKWVEAESVPMAQTVAYRNGTLPGSPEKNTAPALPADYATAAKATAYKQAALAGYRLAKVLEQGLE